jgi:hypothetical protein
MTDCSFSQHMGMSEKQLGMSFFAIDSCRKPSYSLAAPKGASRKRSLKISSQRSAISIQPQQPKTLHP